MFVILGHGDFSSVFWRPSGTAHLNPGNAGAERDPKPSRNQVKVTWESSGEPAEGMSGREVKGVCS